MKPLSEIQHFVWMNEPVCRTWPDADFNRWVEFHYSNGLICCVHDFDETLVGVALIRPVMSPMNALDPMNYDPEGSCLHISQVCCTAKHALTALGFAALKRFGMREFVSWHRQPDQKLIVHKATALRRNLFRRVLA